MSTDINSDLSLIGAQDHTETNEYRIFGPPGTGKTRRTTKLIAGAADRHGANSILVTSFSRAAAAELVGRNLAIPSEQIGTLHSFCWRALGKPEIAEANVSEWNRRNPSHQLTSVKHEQKLDGDSPGEDGPATARSGDRLLGEVNRLRGMMVPRSQWPIAVLSFEKTWIEYKRQRKLMDFCDLIDVARHELPYAPSRPSVVFADEAQDLNPLQRDLVRTWGRNAEYHVIAGDDDQTIYSWCGAVPEAMLKPDIPAGHRIILRTSYRVPRRIHAAADRLIRRVSIRQEKEYLPRPEDGQYIRTLPASFKCPEYALLKALNGHLRRGQSVMVLASCSYMLEPVIALLRKEGIPFHNPFRKSEGRWNPLGGQRRQSPKRIVAELLDGKGNWTIGLFQELCNLVNPDLIRRDGANLFEGASPSQLVLGDIVRAAFRSEVAESLLAARSNPQALNNWFRRSARSELQSRFRFPMAIVQHHGTSALVAEPKVVVGTIHSVKGGEADVVFLFPDLSVAAAGCYERHGRPRDSVLRLFYVAMTRARDALYICEPASGNAVVL